MRASFCSHERGRGCGVEGMSTWGVCLGGGGGWWGWADTSLTGQDKSQKLSCGLPWSIGKIILTYKFIRYDVCTYYAAHSHQGSSPPSACICVQVCQQALHHYEFAFCITGESEESIALEPHKMYWTYPNCFLKIDFVFYLLGNFGLLFKGSFCFS